MPGDTTTIRLPPEWRDSLRRHALAAGLSPHRFMRASIIGRLRRLDGRAEDRADPAAPTAARLRLLLEDVRDAADQGSAVVTLPVRDLERLLDAAVRAVTQQEHADDGI